MKKLLFPILALVLVAGLAVPMAAPAGADPVCSVEWLAEDTITQGDWYFDPEGSPIGVYGSYAYILPNPPVTKVEVVVGDFSVPIGGYSELPDPPYNWTSSQIDGLAHHEPNPPYWDEYWSESPEVEYYVSGTEICLEPRGLVNTENDDEMTRASVWWHPTEVEFDLDLTAGTYLLSFYLLDWAEAGRTQDITVTHATDPTVTGTGSASDFANGKYENFFVYLTAAATLDVEIEKTGPSNAVVSGVFLSTTEIDPTDPLTDEIYWESEDAATQGHWEGVYGDIGYIKCAWNVLETKTNYAWDSDYDEADDGITYDVAEGVNQYAATYKTDLCIQYPVFEWDPKGSVGGDPVWYGTPPVDDPRCAYYPSEGEYRFAVWDDGGERCKPEHGWMDFHLTFPEGTYLLSLYAYDYSRTRQSLTYQIYEDVDGEIGTLLDSRQISGDAFNEGVYEIFKVVAPAEGCTIIVRVNNDAGHPTPNLNVLMSGIFVDKLEQVCGLTIGFWKTNAAKDLRLNKGKAQVDAAEYMSLLPCVYRALSGSITDSNDWNISPPWSREDLRWALHWLSYGAYELDGTWGWTTPEASDPQVKARAQLLALLLTTCYKGPAYTGALIAVPGYDGLMTVADWIHRVIRYYNAGLYDDAYEIANYLNEHCALSPVDP